MGFPQFATQGWNMFETHYLTGGACPPVLSAHSGGLQWLDPITNAWESVETVPGITYNWRWNESGTDCLNRDDGTGRGYYYTLTFPSSQDWYVDSCPSQVPQPPTGGECDPAVSDCCDTYGACSCDLYNLDQCCGVSGGGFGCGDCGDIIYYSQHGIDCYAKGSSVRRSVNGNRRRQSSIAPPGALPGARGSSGVADRLTRSP
ncbi:MAG: hypothetical protein QOF71_3176 [Candidatus Eremiobacteraeota bacterium]|nr:hypothetical protein [Candidatus Eremiobacteraeota bacterium]